MRGGYAEVRQTGERRGDKEGGGINMCVCVWDEWVREGVCGGGALKAR